MPSSSELIYCYDGSFEGLICCVFESYESNEIPIDILLSDNAHSLLFATKSIPTDPQKATRVLTAIPQKLGSSALTFIQQAFLTCLAQKELYILLFLRLGFRHGPSVMNMLTNEVVNTLTKAVKHLERESHLFKGFVRFSIINNVLVGEIEPKNFVLPLLIQHFYERYPEERFLIHDIKHNMALVYQPYQSAIIPLVEFEVPKADKAEQTYRELWQLFYDTIAIQGRYNPKCRMTHIPKRYWKNMTEFNPRSQNTSSAIPASGDNLLQTLTQLTNEIHKPLP